MGFLTTLLLATVFQINPTPMDQSPFQGVVMIRGRAVDEYGHGLWPVRVHALSGSETAVTITDKAGYFYFLSLLPGNYILDAEPMFVRTLVILGPRRHTVPQCKPSTTEKFELLAGYEYAATIWVFGDCH